MNAQLDPAVVSPSTERLSEIIQKLTSRRKLVKGGMATIGAGAAGLTALRYGGAALAQDSGTPPLGEPPSGGAGGGPGAQEITDEFLGVTTDGTIVPDLFELRDTDVTTLPVKEAVEAFLSTLTDVQKSAVMFAVDDDEWRMWSNIDGYSRQGISYREMTDEQKTAANDILAASLSASGLDKVQATMKLNHTEGELMGNFDGFDEDLYYVTVMGEPSETEPWGWQLDGHHLVINYFILGDEVVMTPVFMGAEPTIAPEGTDYAGLSVLIPEQDKGLAFVNTLTADQLAMAVVDTNKAGENMQAGAFADNAVIPYAGIQGSDMTADQQEQLLDLIMEYTGNVDDGHAAIRIQDVRDHIADTWFSWVGDTGEDAVFYYRVQSPVVLIEFDHQSPGPLGRSSDYYGGATGPQRAHVHTVVRTPNGNDYGKDMLAQHYATSAHHSGSTLLGGMALIGTLAAARPFLAPRYRNGATVSNAPMPAAELIYNPDGSVAWNDVWSGFCDLAIAGGPPHRAALLEPGNPESIAADPDAYAQVLDELDRALSLITGWAVDRDTAPGWIGLICPDDETAHWLVRAIMVENIACRQEGRILLLPAGPDFAVKHEIKNVVTAVAKTHHYWMEHAFQYWSAIPA